MHNPSESFWPEGRVGEGCRYVRTYLPTKLPNYLPDYVPVPSQVLTLP